MGNMSYCRFENTYDDLRDCLEALEDAGSVEAVQEEANSTERIYVKRLVELCKEINERYGDDGVNIFDR